MNIIKLNLKLFFFIFLFFSVTAKAEEIKKLPKEHEFNFYSGMFDFSDKGAK